MGMRTALATGWMICFFLAARVMAQEIPRSLEDPLDAFDAIRGFGKIELVLYGDAEAAGLSRAELYGFIMQRILESFKDMKVLPLPEIPLNYTDNKAIRSYLAELYGLGYVFVGVFVVGKDYPVAYHIEYRFGNCLYMDESKKWPLWEREALGFTSRKELKGDVMKWLAKLTEIMAKDFQDARNN
ncbi:MAG: hypothetical protein JRJ03_15820 [Deltaproteobacteria bacterium]|nr:hypothetical protein [Deltaproteobacteria bacterium]